MLEIGYRHVLRHSTFQQNIMRSIRVDVCSLVKAEPNLAHFYPREVPGTRRLVLPATRLYSTTNQQVLRASPDGASSQRTTKRSAAGT